VAERFGVPAHLVDDASQLQPEWFTGRPRVGVTAGASAPEVLVTELIDALKRLGAQRVRTLDGVTEDVVFPMPRGLGRTAVSP
jgi:4-hydroxy-3-methylbut-2-enyl diphosphate reductase